MMQRSNIPQSQVESRISEDEDAEATHPNSLNHHSDEEGLMSYTQTDETSLISLSLIKATIYASISGLLFGYQTGITSGALHSLQSSLDLNSSQTESVSSFFFFGLMIASPFGGEACDRFGRRKTILYTDGVFGFASLILLFANGINIILMGRFISGCASGIALVSAVSYLTEVASGDHRGTLVSAVEASVSLGFLLAYMTSYLMLKFVHMEETWRLLFGLGQGLLSFIQWLGMRRMPESPEWLEQMGFRGKAEEALRCFGVRNSNLVKEINNEYTSTTMHHEYGGVKNIFSLESWVSIAQYWKQIVIIAFLAIAEQFCGHINIMNYAPIIFAEAFFNYTEEQATKDGGATANELLSTTIILGLVKFVVTTFVLLEVDKLGRLFLMKTGAGLVSLSLFCLAVGFSVNLEIAYESEAGTTEYVHSSFEKAMVLIGCTGCVAGFALSYGPITWLIASELSPASIRGRMLGFYTVLTHGSAALVSYTFLSGQVKYSEAAPFWLYFVCSVVSCLFIALAVPETGNVDDGDVESLLDDLWFWSEDNPFYCRNHPALECRICKKRSQNQRGEEMERINSCFENGDRDRSQISRDVEFV